MEYTEEIFNKAKPNDEFEFECKYCHKIFAKTKRDISRNKGKIPQYCCVECSHKGYNQGTIIVKCKQCGKEKEISVSDYNKKIKRYGNDNFFCDQSCAATYNNKKFPKRIKNEDDNICPQCGKYKTYKATLCQECRHKEMRSVQDFELGHYIGYEDTKKKYLAGKCTDIRRDAKRTMLESNVEKVCAYCHNHEFDNILEVHHIKGILTFPPTTKIGEINDISNLVWLCPNHHTMLEKGMISLETNNIEKE